MNKPRIAVDAMGGDHCPEVVIDGAVQALRSVAARLLLVGDSVVINSCLEKYAGENLDIEVVHASQVFEMSEDARKLIREKKDTSVQVAFRLVKEGRADGVVSAGHSGATYACGRRTLGRIKGIDRPALATVLPTEGEPLLLLDVGANTECQPEHLVQFALMADAFVKAVLQIKNPKIGILSIGEEEGKGNALVKQAYTLLKDAPVNFVGNLEGRDLYDGRHAHVAVCDGFVGNIALKLSEGLGTSLGNMLREELKHSFWGRLGAVLALGPLKRLKQRIDYAEYGGAPLLGLKGFVVVCHGKSNSKAICNAVKMAALYVSKQVNKALIDALEQMEDSSEVSE